MPKSNLKRHQSIAHNKSTSDSSLTAEKPLPKSNPLIWKLWLFFVALLAIGAAVFFGRRSNNKNTIDNNCEGLILYRTSQPGNLDLSSYRTILFGMNHEREDDMKKINQCMESLVDSSTVVLSEGAVRNKAVDCSEFFSKNSLGVKCFGWDDKEIHSEYFRLQWRYEIMRRFIEGAKKDPENFASGLMRTMQLSDAGWESIKGKAIFDLTQKDMAVLERHYTIRIASSFFELINKTKSFNSVLNEFNQVQNKLQHFLRDYKKLILKRNQGIAEEISTRTKHKNRLFITSGFFHFVYEEDINKNYYDFVINSDGKTHREAVDIIYQSLRALQEPYAVVIKEVPNETELSKYPKI